MKGLALGISSAPVLFSQAEVPFQMSPTNGPFLGVVNAYEKTGLTGDIFNVSKLPSPPRGSP
jgi:hypothetical protein